MTWLASSIRFDSRRWRRACVGFEFVFGFIIGAIKFARMRESRFHRTCLVLRLQHSLWVRQGQRFIPFWISLSLLIFIQKQFYCSMPFRFHCYYVARGSAIIKLDLLNKYFKITSMKYLFFVHLFYFYLASLYYFE